jgi:putative ABC transport system substrate-binding protein
MLRRQFLALVGGTGAAALPIAMLAREPDRVPRIGCLSPANGFNPVDEAFEKSLQQLGWVKDRNIKIEIRYTGGRQDKVGPLVAEVVGLGLDLFVAWTPPVALAVKQAAPQSPLVFLAGSDVIEVGLVSNLARPGGNVTGITAFASPDFQEKRFA